MKRLFVILLSLVLAVGASSDPTVDYISKYSDLAIREMKRTGVPASITLAQGILESNSGQSKLAVKGNNHFGIKCHNDWDGKTMRRDDDARRECFRVYPNAEASFRDHSDFLRYRDRYKSLFDLDPEDYKGWARGLKKAGYATDPSYANKLIALIEKYELYRYDRNVKVSEETPLKIETPRELPPETVQRNYRETVNVSLQRRIYEVNGVPFVYSLDGETYRSIAAANGLFTKELLRFNDLDSEAPIEPGTVVFLARKKAQAAKGVSKYVVGRDGETLWEISQRFGVRLDAVEKLNPMLVDIYLEEGDTVLLRKEK